MRCHCAPFRDTVILCTVDAEAKQDAVLLITYSIKEPICFIGVGQE